MVIIITKIIAVLIKIIKIISLISSWQTFPYNNIALLAYFYQHANLRQLIYSMK